MDLSSLVSVSRRYGADPALVLAGGGNTSFKDETTLWVKSSGQTLATIAADGFVAVDRKALAALWGRAYSAEEKVREAEVLADLMAARLPGEETKRPSVETLLHDLLPFAWVVHTHPTVVNGLTCGQNGEAVFRELFADEGVWIPLVNPGYVLATVVKAALEAFQAHRGRVPQLVFLQNHGIVVAGQSEAEVDALYSSVLGRLEARVRRRPDLTPRMVSPAAIEAVKAQLGAGVHLRSLANAEIEALATAMGFAALASAFTPDHIVYMGVCPVRVDRPDQLPAAMADWRARWGKDARALLVKGQGAFFVGTTEKAALLAEQLFLDAVAVSRYAENFGGPRFMTPEHIDFIVHWEVESYRAKVSG